MPSFTTILHAYFNLYVPHHLRGLYDEYGAIIIDTLLALPFVRVFRSFLTRFRNHSKAMEARPSIIQLPDELLLEICTILYLSGPSAAQSNRIWVRKLSNETLAVVSFSMTNQRMRNLCAPLIFKHVKISSRHGYEWLKASRSLKTAERSHDAQTLSTALSLAVHSGDHEISRPPKSFPRRLARLLPQFDRVRKLTVIVPNYSGTIFKKTFESCGLELPNVRILILNSHLEWLVPMCPNLEVLSTSSVHWLTSSNGTWPTEQPFELIKAAGKARNLSYFEMHEDWNIELLQAVLRSMPNIQSLAMPGRRYHDGIETLLPTLSQFRHLRTLSLSGPAGLDVGFDGGPTCGNAFFGPGGAEYQRQVEEESRRAVLYVGTMVFRTLDGLEHLYVGDYDKAAALPGDYSCRQVVWTVEQRLLPTNMQ